MAQHASKSTKTAHKINKTKQSLILGFAAIIGLMAFLVIFRSNELEVTKSHIDKIGKNHLTKIGLIVQMRSAAHERTLALQRMMLQTDPFVRDEEWIRFNRLGAEFARARLHILSMQLTQREKTLLDYQGGVTKKAQALQKRVIDLLNNDKFGQAREILLKSVIPIKEQVINQLNTFYHYQETEAEKIARDTSELYQEMRSLILVVSAIALALGVAIATYMVRRTANAESALTNAYANIQKQSAEKSQFLADVIDEYRSPLNSLMHYSDAIARNMRNDKSNSKEFLSDIIKIQNACHHLNGLTTEIIGLTNVEAGKDTLSAQDLDICEFVNDVADRFRPIAAKNNNQIEIQCPNDIGYMETDPTKLQQILFNLLANACKYTEFGLITLNVKYETTRGNANGTGNQRWITFSVIDTGIGIAPEKVDRIFNAIPNISRPISKHQEDSGLNLAISRRICHMMGGEIMINSEPGMGSVFSVKLPFEANPVVA
ncbi:MAG: ATP-binding protein [Gammaproteobacteria bacterium]|jgi:signal transduction histidine kinase